MCKLKTRLKELRNEKGMTLKELGKQLSVRDNTLSQYENDKRDPQYGFLEEAANYFGVSIEYLTGETDKRDYPLKDKQDVISLLTKISKKEISQMNLSHLTALRLSLWIVNNYHLFDKSEELYKLREAAEIVVDDTSQIEQALKAYSFSRKKINDEVDEIDDKLINFEDDYASSGQVLRFLEISKKLSYENVEKALKYMESLPTFDEENDC